MFYYPGLSVGVSLALTEKFLFIWDNLHEFSFLDIQS